MIEAEKNAVSKSPQAFVDQWKWSSCNTETLVEMIAARDAYSRASIWHDATKKLPEPSTPMKTVWVWARYRHDFPPKAPWEYGRCRWLAVAGKWTTDGGPSEVIVSHWTDLPEVPAEMLGNEK